MNKKYLVLLATALGSLTASAQKLPTIQEKGLFAPAKVTVNGKADEWDYKAYNTSTSIFYTIANDADNLYVIAKATDVNVINKLMLGGLTFRMANKGNAADGTIAITYPRLNNKIGGGIVARLRDDDVKTLSTPVVDTLNNRLDVNEKEIGITGLKEFPENVISVYNEQGIKASSRVDAAKAYTIELKIPLGLVRAAFKTPNAFDYNITVNSILTNPGSVGIVNGRVESPNSAAIGERLSKMPASPQVMAMREMIASTDFSGVYVMASK